MSQSIIPYQVPLRTQLARALLRPAFRNLIRLICRVRIEGMENIPPGGPYVVAHNHISIFEPPILLAFWPNPLEAVGASYLWDKGGAYTLVRLYGTIPVHRGEYDRKLIESMVSVLYSGRSLLIAPEGRRSHVPGLQRAWPGISYIVSKAAAPVVPVGVVGSTPDLLARAARGQRPPLEVRIGKPFELPPLEGAGSELRRARQRNADLVMERIAELLPPDYRGEYAAPTGARAEA